MTNNEESVLRATFTATMLRAADIVERVTARDVANAQLQMHREGMSLERLAKIDRATLAVAHLRACALRDRENIRDNTILELKR